MTPDGITFAPWQAYYRNETQNRATLGIRVHKGNITLTTATGDRLHFTPLEAGLLLEALTAAIQHLSTS